MSNLFSAFSEQENQEPLIKLWKWFYHGNTGLVSHRVLLACTDGQPCYKHLSLQYRGSSYLEHFYHILALVILLSVSCLTFPCKIETKMVTALPPFVVLLIFPRLPSLQINLVLLILGFFWLRFNY